MGFAAHKGVSTRARNPLPSPSLSYIRQHSRVNNYELGINDFTIPTKAKSHDDKIFRLNKHKTRLKELDDLRTAEQRGNFHSSGCCYSLCFSPHFTAPLFRVLFRSCSSWRGGASLGGASRAAACSELAPPDLCFNCVLLMLLF